jgi:alanyl-tRNA synthetase
MLGNWSLGDYFKKDAINWSYEFLTNKEDGLGLDPRKLYVTVFEGNDDAPRDEEAYEIWKNIFVNTGLNPDGHIFFMSAESNWWSPGDNGPCGPDTEMFYSTAGDLGDLTKEEFIEADDKQQIVEIWNDVFMEYEKKDGKVIGKLKQHNVDTGAGLERLATMLQGKTNVYDTDLFSTLIEKINSKLQTPNLSTGQAGYKQIQNSNNQNAKSIRIIADHVRTAVFLISDGVVPANTDAGYVLRRIIRRTVRHLDLLGIPEESLLDLADIVINQYGEVYKNVGERGSIIKEEIKKEEEKFRQTLNKGLKQLEKISGDISGKDAFILFATYGFPIEMTEEIAKEKGVSVDMKNYEEEMKKHQELSKTASAGKFKGGLGGHDEQSTKLHTATHLLHQALRDVLGDHISQKGSNITPERLRFDFSHSEKMTDEQIKQVEKIVNQKIKENLNVEMQEMSVSEAKEKGALGVFDDKYGEKVKVYSVGSFSKEICGGPHIKNTSELGVFKIKKEEASSAGVRRIKAILE